LLLRYRRLSVAASYHPGGGDVGRQL